MMGTAHEATLPGHLNGYVAQVHVQLPDSAPLNVVGMYCPHNMRNRRHIYSTMQDIHDKTTDPMIVAGDFNATALDSDRLSRKRHAADTAHRRFMQRHNLRPLDTPKDGADRTYTFRKSSELYCSRIDDILVNVPTQEDCRTLTISMEGRSSDHDQLVASIPFTTLRQFPPLTPPAPSESPEPRLLPLTQRATDALKLQLQESQGDAYEHLYRYTERLVATYARPHWQMLKQHEADKPQPLTELDDTPARQVINDLGKQLSELMQASRSIMMDVCPTRPANIRGTHYRPWKEAKSRRKTVTLLKTTARLMHRLRVSNTLDDAADDAEAAVIAIAERFEERHPGTSREEALKATQARLRDKRNRIDKEHTKIQEQEAAASFQMLLNSNQKLGNKLALGKHKPNPPVALRAVQTPEGLLATTAEEVTEVTKTWARNKMKAPEPNGKTGKYLPEEAPRNYPWANQEYASEGDPLADNLPTGPRRWLHHAIDDEVAIATCLKTLARGKATGPDKVANELLQALPPSGQRALHNMIRLMWATGLTPDDWKESTTIMLYKHKGSPLLLDFFRRIGLEITVYKLWTRMVTFAMADRAERQNMLSASQTGFRSKRSTAQQMEMMVLALEDAYWFKQDIFLLQADMTEAFDTISHDKPAALHPLRPWVPH